MKDNSMTDYKSVFQEIRKLRKEYGDVRKEMEQPISIIYIKKLMNEDPSLINDVKFKHFLYAEYIFYNMDAEYIAELNSDIKQNPDKPEKKIPLAHHLARCGRHGEAITLMREVVNEFESRDEVSFVGYGYNEMARLAVQIKNKNYLLEAVKKLMSHNFGLEKNFLYDASFLKNLSDDAIDPQILKPLIAKIEEHNSKLK